MRGPSTTATITAYGIPWTLTFTPVGLYVDGKPHTPIAPLPEGWAVGVDLDGDVTSLHIGSWDYEWAHWGWIREQGGQWREIGPGGAPAVIRDTMRALHKALGRPCPWETPSIVTVSDDPPNPHGLDGIAGHAARAGVAVPTVVIPRDCKGCVHLVSGDCAAHPGQLRAGGCFGWHYNNGG